VPSLYSNPNQAGIPQAFWKNTSLNFVDDIEHFNQPMWHLLWSLSMSRS